ncbi:MAG TPA: hypothetical protein V6C97_03365, partial [Oculatellaceae cyanobacterium]
MPSIFTSPEQYLWELSHADATEAINQRIMWTKQDNEQVMQAHDLLVQRAEQIETLQRTCDNAVRDLANAQREIEARKAELREAYRIQADTEEQLSKLRRETIDVEVALLNFQRIEFTLECLDGANLN